MRGSPPERSLPASGARVVYLGEQARFHGGGESSLIEMAAGMAAAGFTTLVLLPGPGPIAARCEAAGIPWDRFPLPRLRHPIAVLGAASRLARILRRVGAGLVHTGGPRAALVAGIARHASGAAHIFHVRAARPERWCGDRLILALADRVIAVSRAAAGRSRALARSPRVAVVPTGIAPLARLERPAARALLGIGPRDLTLGVVGRVEADKGAATILAAWPAIRAACAGARLVFLGAIDPRFAARAPDAPPGVLFAGDHPSASRYLPAFDLVVHAARHEALPRVLIEAAFAGIPVVATRVGGVMEALPEGECAVLVGPDDPSALAAACIALARDPDRRGALAAAARRHAERHFDLATMVRGVARIYGEFGDLRAAPVRAAEAGTR
jgi:glycosyltransferase involved in cell wall biosynthesis